MNYKKAYYKLLDHARDAINYIDIAVEGGDNSGTLPVVKIKIERGMPRKITAIKKPPLRAVTLEGGM